VRPVDVRPRAFTFAEVVCHTALLLLLLLRPSMDADAFSDALRKLSGSRTSVQAAAAFFATHAPECTARLCALAAELQGAECFDQRLRLLFVVNEALLLGVAPVALLGGLPTLLRLAAAAAPDAAALAKLVSLVRLWETRAMVPAEAAPGLLAAAAPHETAVSLVVEDAALPAGLLPALVRRVGAGYTPLPRADVQAAARVSVGELLPAAALGLRVQMFYEEAAPSARTRRRDDAAAQHEPQPASAFAGRGGAHTGIGGGASDESDADAFRRAKSAAYRTALATSK